MKFIAKEQELNLEAGDVIEYVINNSVIRFLIVKGYDDEGWSGYKLFDIEGNEVLGDFYSETEGILNDYKGIKGFRIIKSKNLELREV